MHLRDQGRNDVDSFHFMIRAGDGGIKPEPNKRNVFYK